MKELISNNFAPVTGLVLLLSFLVENNKISQQKKRFFLIALGTFGLEIIARNVDIYSSMVDYRNLTREISSAFGYFIRPFIIYALLGVELDLSQKKIKILYTLLTIPLVLNAIGAFSVFFTDLFYSFTEQNSFQRGPLGWTLWVASPVYLSLMFFRIVEDIIKRNRELAGMGIGCILLVIIGMLVEYMNFPPLTAECAMVMALVFYFMFYQSDSFSRERAELENAAQRDALTGLLNRNGYNVLTEQYAGEDIPLGFLILDIDFFKTYNDTYGHEMGDQILQTVARALSSAFRVSDKVIRFGGDEFVVILPGVTADLANVVKTKISSLNNLLQNPISDFPKVSVSVGLAFSEHGYNDELFRHADEALYHMKGGKRKGCCVYGEYEAHSEEEAREALEAREAKEARAEEEARELEELRATAQINTEQVKTMLGENE